jgi:hypothetical protein
MKVKGQTPDREHHWALSARRNLIPVLGYLLRRIFTFVILLFIGRYLALIDGCSLFKPVSQQDTVIKCVDYSVTPLLPGEHYVGSLVAFDITTGLPLLSTAHRAQAYCAQPGAPTVWPETSEPNIFDAVKNLPATAGAMIPSAGAGAMLK